MDERMNILHKLDSCLSCPYETVTEVCTLMFLAQNYVKSKTNKKLIKKERNKRTLTPMKNGQAVTFCQDSGKMDLYIYIYIGGHIICV